MAISAVPTALLTDVNPAVLAKFQPGQLPSARRDLVCRIHHAASRCPHHQTAPAHHRPLPAPPGSASDGAEKRQPECPLRAAAPPAHPRGARTPRAHAGTGPSRSAAADDSEHLTITTVTVVADIHPSLAHHNVSSHHRRFQSGNAWEDALDFSGGARRRPSHHPTAAGGCSALLSLSGALS